jgi:hypothetical protein
MSWNLRLTRDTLARSGSVTKERTLSTSSSGNLWNSGKMWRSDFPGALSILLPARSASSQGDGEEGRFRRKRKTLDPSFACLYHLSCNLEEAEQSPARVGDIWDDLAPGRQGFDKFVTFVSL